MTRENLSVGRLLNTPTTQRMSKIEFDNTDYIESCMVFKNFTSLDSGRSREFVAKFNHPDEAKDFIKNYNQIYNYHEAQLKDKDEKLQQLDDAYASVVSDFESAVMELAKKDEAITELNHTVSGLNEMYLEAKEEIERLKAELAIATKRFDAKNREGKALKKTLSMAWSKQLKEQQ